MLALAPEDLQALVHPEDRERVWGRYRARLAGEEVPSEYELRAFRKDGSLWWISLHSGRITYDGRPAIQCVILDITERKQLEKARRESEEKYGNLFQHCNDAILIHDLEGNILDVNRRTLQMFDCSKSEICGVKIQDLHPPEDQEKAGRAFETIARDGVVNFEISFVKKNDEVFPAELSSSMLEVQGQKVIQGIVRDITERKNAERALRRSEEQHRSLVENINEVIFTLDTKGRFTYISPVMERVLGYTPADITGKPFDCFVHPDDAAGFLVKLEQSLNGAVQTHELKVLSKDGKTHHVRVSSRPLYHDDRLAGFTGIMADETEAKRAGAVIREKEEMYETLVRTTTDAVTVTDLQGTITEVSPRAVQLYGYDKPEDLVGMSGFDLIAPEDQGKALSNLKRTLKEGFIRLAEHTFLRKDGTRFVGEMDAAVIKDADGGPRGFISTTKDVTERRRAEDALKRSERRFRDIAEHASEWIWEVDTNGIYTYSSPVVKRILGYEPEEILGKHFYDLFPPEGRAEARERAFDIFATKQPFRDHLNRNIHKDGHEVVLSTSGVPILDDDGSLMGYRGADTDVTRECGTGKDDVRDK
jgi:PAS domain S-box-containing protein